MLPNRDSVLNKGYAFAGTPFVKITAKSTGTAPNASGLAFAGTPFVPTSNASAPAAPFVPHMQICM